MPTGKTRVPATALWQDLYDVVLAVYEDNLEEAIAQHGLTGGEIKSLVKLTPGKGVPMRALAEAWHSDASTVTWMVDRLEARGLVERRPKPGDRRVRVVVLTTNGEATLAEVRAQLYAPPAAWAKLSRDELACLNRIVAKVRGAEPERP
jgi:DNA-binding MarR family transcriptional regulator